MLPRDVFYTVKEKHRDYVQDAERKKGRTVNSVIVMIAVNSSVAIMQIHLNTSVKHAGHGMQSASKTINAPAAEKNSGKDIQKKSARNVWKSSIVTYKLLVSSPVSDNGL